MARSLGGQCSRGSTDLCMYVWWCWWCVVVFGGVYVKVVCVMGTHMQARIYILCSMHTIHAMTHTPRTTPTHTHPHPPTPTTRTHTHPPHPRRSSGPAIAAVYVMGTLTTTMTNSSAVTDVVSQCTNYATVSPTRQTPRGCGCVAHASTWKNRRGALAPWEPLYSAHNAVYAQ